MYSRDVEAKIISRLRHNSAVGILGPRSIGKTTLALAISKKYPHIYLDLEDTDTRIKLARDNPFHYFMLYKDRLIILDKAQFCPDLFKTLRGVIDAGIREGYRNGRFLILGPGSPSLMNQSSQSLAGRISYVTLAGLNPLEIEHSQDSLLKLWLRGGFPLSHSSSSDKISMNGRKNIVESYFTEEIRHFGVELSLEKLRNFWHLLALYQGLRWHPEEFARSLMISEKEMRHYLWFMEEWLLVRRVVLPWHPGVKTPRDESPRVYIRDSGFLHQLWNVSEYSQLFAHPLVGKSWEGFVIESILSVSDEPFVELYFYRDDDGCEIDLLLKMGNEDFWAVEIKLSRAKPKVPKGFHRACEDLGVGRKFIVYGGEKTLALSHGTQAMSLRGFMKLLKKYQSEKWIG